MKKDRNLTYNKKIFNKKWNIKNKKNDNKVHNKNNNNNIIINLNIKNNCNSNNKINENYQIDCNDLIIPDKNNCKNKDLNNKNNIMINISNNNSNEQVEAENINIVKNNNTTGKNNYNNIDINKINEKNIMEKDNINKEKQEIYNIEKNISKNCVNNELENKIKKNIVQENNNISKLDDLNYINENKKYTELNKENIVNDKKLKQNINNINQNYDFIENLNKKEICNPEIEVTNNCKINNNLKENLNPKIDINTANNYNEPNPIVIINTNNNNKEKDKNINNNNYSNLKENLNPKMDINTANNYKVTNPIVIINTNNINNEKDKNVNYKEKDKSVNYKEKYNINSIVNKFNDNKGENVNFKEKDNTNSMINEIENKINDNNGENINFKEKDNTNSMINEIENKINDNNGDNINLKEKDNTNLIEKKINIKEKDEINPIIKNIINKSDDINIKEKYINNSVVKNIINKNIDENIDINEKYNSKLIVNENIENIKTKEIDSNSIVKNINNNYNYENVNTNETDNNLIVNNNAENTNSKEIINYNFKEKNGYNLLSKDNINYNKTNNLNKDILEEIDTNNNSNSWVKINKTNNFKENHTNKFYNNTNSGDNLNIKINSNTNIKNSKFHLKKLQSENYKINDDNPNKAVNSNTSINYDNIIDRNYKLQKYSHKNINTNINNPKNINRNNNIFKREANKFFGKNEKIKIVKELEVVEILEDYSDIFPCFNSIFSSYHINKFDNSIYSEIIHAYVIHYGYFDRINSYISKINFELNSLEFSAADFLFKNNKNKLNTLLSNTCFNIEQYYKKLNSFFNKNEDYFNNKNDYQYYRIIKNKSNVYDIVSRGFNRIGNWKELPHGANFKNTFQLLWSWSKPTIEFEKLTVFQKFNHFINNKFFVRKDLLKKSIENIRKKNKTLKNMFKITPKSFLLPMDFVKLTQDMEKNKAKGKYTYYIMKPYAKSRGRGISLISDLNDVCYADPVIIQKYITNPLLYKGFKFDLRIYIWVTNWKDLEIFIYKEGFARLCSEKFSLKKEDLKNTFIHLTNYAINKLNQNPEFEKMDEYGSKITLTMLREKIELNGINWNKIWVQIKSIALKACISIEKDIVKIPNCFELFGFDILIDDTYKCWLIEINSSPSMHRDTLIDDIVKQNWIDDTIELIQNPAINVKNFLDILKRRKEEEFKFKSKIKYDNNSKENLNKDFNKIFNGKHIRRVGEKLKIYSNYEMVSPSKESERIKNLLYKKVAK